jgi:hypothetical protein
LQNFIAEPVVIGLPLMLEPHRNRRRLDVVAKGELPLERGDDGGVMDPGGNFDLHSRRVSKD